MQKHNACVIGLGNIGQGLDYSQSARSVVLTHAQAFKAHPAFNLVAAVDPDPLKRKRFEKKFQRPSFPTMSHLKAVPRIDVFSIGVPTSHHFKAFAETLQYGPKAVLCEKPLAATLRDAERMVQMAERANCLLGINYFRRFDPGMINLRNGIRNGRYGEIYKGVAWYSKGIYNAASHFVDLMIFLFGLPKQISVIANGKSHYQGDPEPDFMVQFGPAEIVFLSGREKDYSVRDVELIGTKGAVRIVRGGEEIRTYAVERSRLFKGYRLLERIGRPLKTDLKRYQLHVMDALARAVRGQTDFASTGRTAIQTMRCINQVIQKCKPKKS